jgi:hypothetical protein
MRRRTALPRLLIPCLLGSALLCAATPEQLRPFIEKHCVDCHDADDAKGGLDFSKLASDLNQPETLAKWVRIFDRVEQGEMPPKKKARPEAGEKARFTQLLAAGLTTTDRANKATVLRRLNRNELEQTLNDLLGTKEELAPLLPEDGRAQGFDKVGEALDLSSVHLQRTMDAARQALNAAMNKGDAPEKIDKTIGFGDGRNATHIGKSWHKLGDGTVVAFQVAAVASGSLLIGSSAGSATAWAAGSNDRVNAGTNLYWTPAASQAGTLANPLAIGAFSVYAVPETLNAANENTGLLIEAAGVGKVTSPIRTANGDYVFIRPAKADLPKDATTAEESRLFAQRISQRNAYFTGIGLVQDIVPPPVEAK